MDIEAEGTYNLAFDMFLSADVVPFPTPSTHEIMIWVDRTEGLYGVTPDNAVIETIIDGVTYVFHRQDNFDPHNITRPPGEVPDYTNSIQQFIGPEGRLSGTLDLAAFYDWLVDEEHVDPSLYLLGIQFGNEVVDGSGELWLVDYEVTLRER